ncbi:hypothetical protein J3998_06205 [Thiomicrorhabdus sp. 6S2-11]|uniref:Pilus assembly protein PilP n=1 Tax=Thiomicrorhabdus marina TaxID=2818442 RepID=A0ABS3Q4A9_9GAMM|nr:hypothetical protein [Thiomicrorhabdus marina]MBO1927165.1 hypothetical protein [Thiomicrorhabdus marina]
MKRNKYIFVVGLALLTINSLAFSGPTDTTNAMIDSAREVNETTIILERGADGKLKVVDEVESKNLTALQEDAVDKSTKAKTPVVTNPDNDVLNKPLNLQTILLDKPTREKIDRQRAAYINPPVTKEIEKIPPPPPPGKGTGSKNYKPKKKPIYLPGKLAVSAVVMKPNGDSLVRINGKYNNTSSKHITINKEHTSPKGVALEVIDKEQIVPVGSTLMPRKSKVIPTYQMVQQEKARAKRRAVPKTKETVAKDTLEQVQILTKKPKP